MKITIRFILLEFSRHNLYVLRTLTKSCREVVVISGAVHRILLYFAWTFMVEGRQFLTSILNIIHNAISFLPLLVISREWYPDLILEGNTIIQALISIEQRFCILIKLMQLFHLLEPPLSGAAEHSPPLISCFDISL